jgi:competence protein ComEC
MIKAKPPLPFPRYRIFALACVAGVGMQLWQASLWSVISYGVLIAFAGILLLVSLRLRSILSDSTALLLAGCAFGFGFGIAGLQGALAMSHKLSSEREGETINITGTIAQLPVTATDSLRFAFDVDDAPKGVPQRLFVLWHEPADTFHILPGSRYQLSVKLKAVHGTLNHFGFDYELYQLERGMGALATVRPRGDKLYLGDGLSWRTPGYALERLRAKLKARIDDALKDAPYKGVVQALAVGDQSAIEKDDWRVFLDTGVGHLMSISGLHVTMFAWLAGTAVGWLWRRSPRLMLHTPSPTIARWSGLMIACLYAAIAGWGVPAQRTALMLAVSTYALSRGLRYAWFDVLLAALVIVLAFDPWALLQPGFWLSFSAVGFLFWASPSGREEHTATATGIAADTPKYLGWWATIKAASHTQAVATLALIPLSVLFFQQISLVSPLANALAIPLVSLVVTPIAVIGLLLPAPLSIWAWQLAHALLQALQWLLERLALLPHATTSLPAPTPLVLLLALLGTIVLVAPAIGRLRWCGVLLLLPLFLFKPAPPAQGEFFAEFMDIGQGNAVLIRTRTHALLYDTGPAYMSGTDAGERLVLPLLRALGVDALDKLVVSHRDADHSGGAAAVMQGMTVREVNSSMRKDELMEDHSLPFNYCAAGQYWQWDGVKLEYLHPLAEVFSTVYASNSNEMDSSKKSYKPNALSCVLKITSSKGVSVLLVADAEAAQELQMINRDLEAKQHKLKSTVLLMGHHGSKTSSSAAFLDAVQPQTAVAQAGYRSAYGHPHPTVVQRYIDRHISVRRADCEGGLAWRSDAPESFDGARNARWRYWRHVGATAQRGLGCKGLKENAAATTPQTDNEVELIETP